MDQNAIPRNAEKSTTRVNLNSAMIGVIFTILTLIWSLKPENFNIFIIYQLVLAIPLLFISSLAYTKIGYSSNIKLFDRFAWFATTFGTNMVLNTAALIAGTFYRPLGFLYLLVMLLGVTGYYTINIITGSHVYNQVIKLSVIYLIIIFGGLLPLFLYY